MLDVQNAVEVERLMTEQRTKYRTGNEAEEIKASALSDLKMAALQYQEAGGVIKETSYWNDRRTVILVIEDVGIDEWRRR